MARTDSHLPAQAAPITEAEYRADALVTIAPGGRTKWQGTREALDSEGLLNDRLLGPGRSLPPGRCVSRASDGPWSMSLARCRPPWLASGSGGQWNAGDWWRIARTLNVAQACRAQGIRLTPTRAPGARSAEAGTVAVEIGSARPVGTPPGGRLVWLDPPCVSMGPHPSQALAIATRPPSARAPTRIPEKCPADIKDLGDD